MPTEKIEHRSVSTGCDTSLWKASAHVLLNMGLAYASETAGPFVIRWYQEEDSAVGVSLPVTSFTKEMTLWHILILPLLVLLLGGLCLMMLYALLFKVYLICQWKAKPEDLQQFYAKLGDATDLVPIDGSKATYNLFRRNCAAFPEWLLPRMLRCSNIGFMHPFHCKLDLPEPTASIPESSGEQSMMHWLMRAPDLHMQASEQLPHLEYNLDKFLLYAQKRSGRIRIVIAAVWKTPMFYLLSHLTTLLLFEDKILSLGVDAGNNSMTDLLFGSSIPYRLRSPDATIMRSHYHHCRILADYVMDPIEADDVLRRLKEEWKPSSASKVLE